ncbi:hypothetical protein ACOMHN_015552 [Nucella lapillus]
MHAFLKRHYKKSGRGAKSKKEEEETGGPIGILKYHEAVSKSMDSLLMVASSVPLPPEAKLTPPHSERQDSMSSQHHHYSDNDLPAMERRHSFDLAADKLTDEDEDAASISGVSRSEEASPARGGVRVGRSDSMESRETYRALQQSFLKSFGTSASFTSEREMSESDDDRSFVSVRTNDSCVFVGEDVGTVEGLDDAGGESESPLVLSSDDVQAAAEMMQQAGK